MAAPVKAILAGAAVLGAGGTGVWLLYSESMPEGSPLSEDSDIASGYGGKYGEKYARLLVGVKTADTSEQDVKDNKTGGDWAHRNLYKPNQTEAKRGFNNVKRGSKLDSPDGFSLQEACENAYKTNLSDVIAGSPENTETQKFNEGNVWKFCSPAEKKPKTLAEGTDANDSKWNNNLGGNNKEYLLSIAENTEAGKQLDLQFKSKSGNSSGFFKIEDDKPTIKDLCSKAYGESTTGTESNQPTETDLYKGCSLKGIKTTTTTG